MTDNKPENKPQPAPDKSIRISVGGNVGPGTILGTGSIAGKYIAGRDNNITITGAEEVIGKTKQDFSGLLVELRKMVQKAQEIGELSAEAAQEAIEHLDSAAEIATQEKPSKRGLMRKLGDVSDILDAASDTIESAGGAARVLLHAMPVTALLLNLVSYLF